MAKKSAKLLLILVTSWITKSHVHHYKTIGIIILWQIPVGMAMPNWPLMCLTKKMDFSAFMKDHLIFKIKYDGGSLMLLGCFAAGGYY